MFTPMELFRLCFFGAGSVNIHIICNILQGMPKNEFETVTWTKKPSWQEFRGDIERIALEMING